MTLCCAGRGLGGSGEGLTACLHPYYSHTVILAVVICWGCLPCAKCTSIDPPFPTPPSPPSDSPASLVSGEQTVAHLDRLRHASPKATALLEGVSFVPVSFIPSAGRVYINQQCNGVRSPPPSLGFVTKAAYSCARYTGLRMPSEAVCSGALYYFKRHRFSSSAVASRHALLTSLASLVPSADRVGGWEGACFPERPGG